VVLRGICTVLPASLTISTWRGLPFSFDETTIRNGLNFTLTTTLGDLDLLGELVGGGSYEDLLPFTQVVDEHGLRFRCLTLDRLIQVKRAAGRPKTSKPSPNSRPFSRNTGGQETREARSRSMKSLFRCEFSSRVLKLSRTPWLNRLDRPQRPSRSRKEIAGLPIVSEQFAGHPTMKEELEVIPGQAELAMPLFESEHEYQEFGRSYSEQITPELEVLREARRQSEEQSKQHWMC